MKKISLDTKRCRGCGCCVRSCPHGALSLGKGKVEVDDKCIGCGICAKACPFDALKKEG